MPQGSVLGPLLYSIFTNELTEVVQYPTCGKNIHQRTTKLFGDYCKDCGGITQYADDTTYTVSGRSGVKNQLSLDRNLRNLQDFLSANQLAINSGKTKITECMINQKRAKTTGYPPSLNTRNERDEPVVILDGKVCRILGTNILNDGTWRAHLESGPKALLPSLRKNLGSLKFLGRKIPSNCRNTLAKSLITSRLSYLISMWGGTMNNFIRKAQTVLNIAARWVTKMPKKTRICDLIYISKNYNHYDRLISSHALARLANSVANPPLHSFFLALLCRIQAFHRHLSGRTSP